MTLLLIHNTTTGMCGDLASPLTRVHRKVLGQYYMKSDTANISGTGFIFKYT